jgi:hypothetical protein
VTIEVGTVKLLLLLLLLVIGDNDEVLTAFGGIVFGFDTLLRAIRDEVDDDDDDDEEEEETAAAIGEDGTTKGDDATALLCE